MPTDRLESYLRNFTLAAQIEDDGKRMGRCNALLVQLLHEIELKEIADAYTAAAYRVVMDAPKEYPQ